MLAASNSPTPVQPDSHSLISKSTGSTCRTSLGLMRNLHKKQAGFLQKLAQRNSNTAKSKSYAIPSVRIVYDRNPAGPVSTQPGFTPGPLRFRNNNKWLAELMVRVPASVLHF